MADFSTSCARALFKSGQRWRRSGAPPRWRAAPAAVRPTRTACAGYGPSERNPRLALPDRASVRLSSRVPAARPITCKGRRALLMRLFGRFPMEDLSDGHWSPPRGGSGLDDPLCCLAHPQWTRAARSAYRRLLTLNPPDKQLPEPDMPSAAPALDRAYDARR